MPCCGSAQFGISSSWAFSAARSRNGKSKGFRPADRTQEKAVIPLSRRKHLRCMFVFGISISPTGIWLPVVSRRPTDRARQVSVAKAGRAFPIRVPSRSHLRALQRLCKLPRTLPIWRKGFEPTRARRSCSHEACNSERAYDANSFGRNHLLSNTCDFGKAQPGSERCSLWAPQIYFGAHSHLSTSDAHRLTRLLKNSRSGSAGRGQSSPSPRPYSADTYPPLRSPWL